VTAICYIGSKSLSHVLSCIERCKDRLMAIGPASPAARQQIITSVMSYWKDQPGVGVNIVDKLLNYTILTPASIVDWALADGANLAQAHIYELLAATLGKVTTRIRQLVRAKNARGLLPEQRVLLEETVAREREAMRDLWVVVEDKLVGWATGSKDEAMEAGDGTSAEESMVRQWGARWLRVYRRWFSVEEMWFAEAEREAERARLAKQHAPPAAGVETAAADGDGDEEVL